MKISISGKQIDIGAALQQHVEDGIERIVSKYFDQAIGADIVFTKERHMFRTDILANEGTGNNIVIKGRGEAGDIYASFEQAAERIEKQLRRYKRKLRNHHRSSTADEFAFADIAARKFVLASKEEEEATEDAPLIIVEKNAQIEALTVGDAVMKKDLADLPAPMFINKKTGCVSVVYKRIDGNISWIDSGIGSAPVASPKVVDSRPKKVTKKKSAA